MKLFSYKMTDDTGFAPNPFHGFLTLACCKADIRRAKHKGDWIAGFTSMELNGDKVGKEKLVYLMKVTDKVPFEKYWLGKKFRVKRNSSISIIKSRGDNIYKPDQNEKLGFEQIKNNRHKIRNKIDDLSGKYVLISDQFYYFGKEAINIPENIRPNIPKSQAKDGWGTYDQSLIKNFIKYVRIMRKRYRKNLLPHDWSLDKDSRCKSKVSKC